MTKINEIYKCEKCGNIVEMVHGGPGELVCCEVPMIKMEEKTAEMKLEKHVPMITVKDNQVTVFVGSTEHPMLDNHYIEWIEILADNKVYRKHLKPGEKPEAVFNIKASKITAREYCNIHGLWVSEA
ncbi:MAG: desulfoferrodoxin [Candidatus Muirbacterium halophilum]|nr:desulfoferrodoxin [Candidatus Muirbacterium halophilum]MCK9474835.1 desulfoferrodoxin [Candidatus Muirbacterium halophilum]